MAIGKKFTDDFRRGLGRRSLVLRGFFKKRGRVYIAAGEEEYRLLNPPLQEYVTPGWLGKAIACFWKLRETRFFQKTGAGLYSCW
ncbi:hypothetical protein H4N54_23020 [Limnospira fusiformis KN01]|uniref:hypothetical protein n=1 Tax=Limnospira fusiformis TaxID=54297 RepID=UPI001F2151BE|nr:hypothetical protein [Limnospira fusiformis]ULB45241.1 hypothetical protein H4N54_23020 [Limnospira fusiformis KN01]